MRRFYAVRRKLTKEFPEGKVDEKRLEKEYERLNKERTDDYEKFKAVREDLQYLWRVKSNIDTARRFTEEKQQLHQQKREDFEI